MAIAALSAIFGGLEFLFGLLSEETVLAITDFAAETVAANLPEVATEFPDLAASITEPLGGAGSPLGSIADNVQRGFNAGKSLVSNQASGSLAIKPQEQVQPKFK